MNERLKTFEKDEKTMEIWTENFSNPCRTCESKCVK